MGTPTTEDAAVAEVVLLPKLSSPRRELCRKAKQVSNECLFFHGPIRRAGVLCGVFDHLCMPLGESQQESRMREIRMSGLRRGRATALPTLL